jgi:hypothetical protein
MASPMEVDEPAQAGPSQRDKGKGKVGGGPSRQEKGKATLREGARGDGVWVEKYRPKALSDVAAHKDIIDTSKLTYNSCRLSEGSLGDFGDGLHAI